MTEQGSRSASCSEETIFRRLSRNPRDPGCILDYTFSLAGSLHPGRLERALRSTVILHFRSLLDVFEERDGRLLKRARAAPARFLEEIRDNRDWFSLAHHEAASLPEGRLFRFVLVRVSAEFHYLRLAFSHLVFDGGCYAPFVARLGEAYAAETGDADLSVPENAPDVQVIPEATSTVDEEAAFWEATLRGRKLGQRFGFLVGTAPAYTHFFSVRRTLGGEDYAKLRGFVQAEGTTLFRMMVAALAVAVLRYDRDEHADGLAVAHTVDMRPAPGLAGNFANVVPLFIPDRPDWSPRDYLAHVRDERRRVRPHQRYPLLHLVAHADERSNRNAPILNLVVNESQGLLPAVAPCFAGIETALLRTPATGGPFDLGLTFAHDDDALRLSIDVPCELASHALVTAFADNVVETLSRFIANPEAAVDSLVFVRDRTPVSSGSAIACDRVDDLLARVASRAARVPDAPAIVFGTRRLTYGELSTQVARLAARITALATGAALETGIGIAFTRSERLPVAMLAAMSLGVPFVPLERSLPAERLQHVLQTTGLQVVLCDDDGRAHLSVCRADLLFIPVSDDASSMPLPSMPSPCGIVSDTAYILFTSGSTGLPKGVAITRGNLHNFLVSMAEDPGFDAQDRFLALTPISFDISILELLLPLFLGGSMHIVDDATRRSAVDLAREIDRSGVTVVQATPATWRMLKAVDWSSVRPLTVLCGGEALTPEIADYLLEQGHRVHNMYGPTEATIWASCSRIRAGRQIDLGTPVLNTCFHVLDEALRPVADGCTGELVIEGECVGAGYLGQLGGAFLEIEAGRKAYRTGDIVRSLGDGRIVYVGRRDNQRKVNGHRIELDEISLRLRALIGDADVFTVVREQPSPHLCAFYRADIAMQVDAGRILDAARQSLPAYMVPTRLVRLEQLPLTPNGKIDQRFLSTCALPEEALPARPARPVVQDEGTVASLRRLVARTLDVEIDDPEASLGWLGLGSISYSQLSQAIASTFGASVPPHRFYALNTLSALAAEIDAQVGDAVPARADTRSPVDLPANVQQASSADGIAIIGYAVTMPGGMEAEAFWDALMQSRPQIVERHRPGFRAPLHAGFLDQIDGFDARFFSISPLEANQMDPRQRLLLQAAWRAIEDAGHAASTLSGRRIGCYIAATGCDYATLQARAGSGFTPYSLPGSSLSILANRISSFFNWSGPSCTIDTACSGALSAIVRACGDLAAGLCEAALVGGINLIADDQISCGLEAGNFMSPRHRCATFDEQADGYVRGEGLGCFLLKPLASAIADGDAIHGVIKRHVENHGGRSTSLTAPNQEAQVQLLLSAYDEALLGDVGYIETHGTGTRLGDPIEIDALTQAWHRLGWREDGRKVWLGAVKANIGHLEPAAGIASLAKVLLAMRHGVLPPNAHFERLNPLIRLEDSPFAIPDRVQPWPAGAGGRRVAGISSFGFGGSNAHIVVTAPPVAAVWPASASQVLLTVSAKTETAFAAMVAALRDDLRARLDRDEPIDLEALAWTLNLGRSHFNYRAAWIVGSVREFVDALAIGAIPAKTAPHTVSASAESAASPRETRRDRLDRTRAAYLRGDAVDWHGIHEGPARRMRLPTYRFDVQHYWFDRGRTTPALPKQVRQAEDSLS